MLAFACAFTMFAGAAFTDQADIEAAEAVDMLTALGVIDGYEDGSFQPNETVTRAEMAKMIYTIRNGGNATVTQYEGYKTPFADVENTGHWAKGYIAYCYANGIIDGKSATSFDPDATVTGTEAAKMALVLIGYDAERAGLEGSSWTTNTINLATQKDLFKDFSISITGGCDRQYAAQLLYNTLWACTVRWSADAESYEDVVTYEDSQDGTTAKPLNVTVAKRWMGLEEFVGTYEGNSDNLSNLQDGRIQVTNSKGTKYATYDLGLEWLGEEVKVLYKESKNGVTDLDPKDEVFGVYNTGETTVYNITAGDLQDGDDAKIKFGDKEYKAAAKLTVTENYADVYANVEGADSRKAVTAFGKSGGTDGEYYGARPDTIKFVANDGEITAAYVNTYTMARVTAVSSDEVSINNGIGAIAFDGNEIYEDIAKDDIVVIQTFFDDDPESDDAYNVITKADVKSAELTGYKGATENVSFDGETYKVMNGALLGTGVDNDFETSVKDQIGETYDFYMIGSYVAAAKLTSDGAKNYAVVTGKAGHPGNKADPLKVSILTAANEELLVEVDTDGETVVNQDNLISYSVVSDSKIKIKEVEPLATKGVGYVKDTKTFDGVVTTADAPLFVIKGDDYYVYNIRDLNDTVAQGDSAKINDGGKIVAALIERTDTPSGASSDTVYGIVSDAQSAVKVDGTYYTKFVVDTFDKDGNAESKDVLVEGTETTLAKGDLVSFEVRGSDTYNDGDIKRYTDGNNNATAAWVMEYEGDILTVWNNIVKKGSSYEGKADDYTTLAFDDDAVIAFVDVANNKGAVDNGVPAFNDVTGYKNVMYVKDGDKIVGMFVDVKHNILEATSTTASEAATISVKGGAISGKDGFSVEAVPAATLIAGDTIEITVTHESANFDSSKQFELTLSNSQTVEAEGTGDKSITFSYEVTADDVENPTLELTVTGITTKA